MPFDPYELTRRSPEKTPWHLRKGGWVVTIALVEALLAGGITAFFVRTVIALMNVWTTVLSIVLGIAASCLVWVVLARRADSLYETELDAIATALSPYAARAAHNPHFDEVVVREERQRGLCRLWALLIPRFLGNTSSTGRLTHLTWASPAERARRRPNAEVPDELWKARI